MTDDNEIDLGRMTSRLLTEVRTVLSRAENALCPYAGMEGWMSRAELDIVTGVFEWLPEGDPRRVDSVWVLHPDAAEMQAAMEKVVELLRPWARTGRPRKKKP